MTKFANNLFIKFAIIFIPFGIFSVDLSANELIVINEINYHSADDFNPDDWVELYNPLDETINIGNWVFLDEDDTHVFTIPENYLLNSGSFLVLCKNTELFTAVFPEVDNYLGDLGFGLSGGGEPIRIFNSNGELVDEVDYDDEDPWPLEPDGTGPTLELMDPLSDNALPENWSFSEGHGTPGSINSIVLSIDKSSLTPGNLILLDNYPNPFNPITTIQFSVPSIIQNFVGPTFNLSLQIYDLSSKKVATLINGNYNPGFYSVEWNAEGFPSGVYIVKLIVGKISQSEKLLLLK